MKIDARHGKESETHFRLLKCLGDYSLIEARPVTGRTHQIRLHLLEAGLPIVGDDLYGPDAGRRKPPLKHRRRYPMGLRAVELKYFDPFLRKEVSIEAPVEAFLEDFAMEMPRA
jgi:23S rRNA-/tRNA-specific pseudouridylate synthase